MTKIVIWQIILRDSLVNIAPSSSRLRCPDA